MRYWYNPLVNILHFGPDIYGTDGAGSSSPPTGTTGFRKRPGYLIGTLPIQTPLLARAIFGTDGTGGGSSPATGTTGFRKRRGYLIATLPIQTPDLLRAIFGTVVDDGGGGGGGTDDTLTRWRRHGRR